MKIKILLIGLSVLTLVSIVSASDHWAVIVAGSNYYWNYRHQADVCHAYQIMINNNIPEENIIVMAYDDIANDPENPYPGKLFNQPNGKDVYEGCNIDYKGVDVTATNFLKVLQGDSKGVNGSKVLKSSENSKVFIFFTDHGAPGFVAFPNDLLYANDLNTTLTYMHENKMYKELVFYLEACESGSMFEGILDPTIGVYALTASNADESSWGTYCYPDDMIDGKHIGSCLGDLFSVNWMEDSDKNDVKKETLEQQYEIVKELTKQSHVMQYGDMSFINESIGNFEGNYSMSQDTPQFRSFFDILKNKAQYFLNDYNQDTQNYYKKHFSAINTRDSKLNYLYGRVMMNSQSHQAQTDLTMELQRRMKVDHIFSDFRSKSTIIRDDITILPRNFECLKQLVSTYQNQCAKLEEYEMKYIRYFVQECEAMNPNAPSSIDSLIHRIKNVCK